MTDAAPLVVHNRHIAGLVRPAYSRAQIEEILQLLQSRGTLDFPTLPNGLFAASGADREHYTGYGNVWVRDSVHIAHALWRHGQTRKAVAAAGALMRHFQRQRSRFLEIIRTPDLAAEPMRRPHVRFDGAAETDLTESWPHAQNDSVGYFLWLYCGLAIEGLIRPDEEAWRTLALFPPYLDAIRFWEDEDSGHWEEDRKVEASSIGPVCAGLQALADLARRAPLAEQLGPRDIAGQALELFDLGAGQLRSLLPWESRRPPEKQRRYDAALLFLVLPLGIAGDRATAARIASDVRENLMGRYGIKRYLGDSFWCADYRKHVRAADRTRDYSGDMASRDRHWTPDSEAQWCLFDPILSAIYGAWYLESRDPETLGLQTLHLNRSLGQITGEGRLHPAFRCPELYYLEDGAVETSDAVPLLWTQANLLLALDAMRRSVSNITSG